MSSNSKQQRQWEIVDISLKKTQLREEDVLYCEGSMKPYWRGKIHLFAFLLFPFAFAILINEAESLTERIGLLVFTLGHMLSYGISYVFHCFEWSARIEIFLQKCDHAAIFIATASSITQYILFGVKTNVHLMLAAAWVLCIMGTTLVYLRKKETYHHAVSAMVIFWAIPDMLQVMTTYQFQLFLATWAQIGIGMVVYGSRWPKLWPEYFGYHEVMHVLTTSAAITSIILQHSLLSTFDNSFCIFSGNKNDV
mmetsp:Transcript_4891/g.7453  ORF Transcript_4891/g.7453 Transcript_4891/m.7453 type:complete len:252 (+) Transcript_4891:147-902(+)